MLPGVDLATRAVNPSSLFPASWGKDEPLVPSDPRVCWREHYSLDTQRPYYQHVQTMEVTFDIPEGFVTRFPRLYMTNGFRVDERGAVHRITSEGNASGAGGAGDNGSSDTAVKQRGGSGVKSMTLKQKLAAYGAGGLLWYLIIHNISLACVFTCLYVLRIDLISLARSYGFNVKMESADVDPNRRPSFWKTLVLSIVLNKLLVPVQLLFTVTTAPLLVHRLEPFAATLFPKMKAIVQSVLRHPQA